MSMSLLIASVLLTASGGEIWQQNAVEIKKELCRTISKQKWSPMRAKQSPLFLGLLMYLRGDVPSSLPYLNVNRLQPGQVGRISYFEVLQVIGPDKALITYDDVIMLLEGASTEYVADGQKVRTAITCLVGKPESYVSVIGGRSTVHALICIDRMPAVVEYPWYDVKGDLLFVGQCLKVKGLEATFRTVKGEQVVPLLKLAYGDKVLLRVLSDLRVVSKD